MAKRKVKPVPQDIPLQNPVAKFMHRFNKAATHHDKKHYQRNQKHKGLEPFPMHFQFALGKAPVLSLGF